MKRDLQPWRDIARGEMSEYIVSSLNILKEHQLVLQKLLTGEKAAVLILIASVIIVSCNSEDNRTAGGTYGAAEPQVLEIPGSAAPGLNHQAVGNDRTLRFERAEVRDPGLNNMVAFTGLMPAGWRVYGGISWRLELVPHAVVDYSFYDPNGLAAVRFLPGVVYLWTESGPFQGILQPGQVSGRSIVMPPPINNPQWYIQQIVVPQHFSFARNVTIGRIEPMPAVAQQAAQYMAPVAVAAGGSLRLEGYRARLHYEWEGQAYDEDVYFTLVFTRIVNMTGVMWTWLPEMMHSIRAGRGELDELTPLLRVVAANTSPTPEWYAIREQISQSIHTQTMQTLRQMGDLQWQMYQNRQQLSRQHHDQWRNQQAMLDRTHEAFTQYIRGVETYRTPDGARMELPAGYNNAWMRPETGEVVLSNEPRYDPGSYWTRIYR